jgi:hypothetical protein
MSFEQELMLAASMTTAAHDWLLHGRWQSMQEDDDLMGTRERWADE